MNNPNPFSLSTEVFYLSNNFCNPPLDSVLQIYVLVLEPGAPGGVSWEWSGIITSLFLLAVLLLTQPWICLSCCAVSSHIELLVNQHLKVLLLWAPVNPLYCLPCIGTRDCPEPLQPFALGLVSQFKNSRKRSCTSCSPPPSPSSERDKRQRSQVETRIYWKQWWDKKINITETILIKKI